MLIPNLDSAPLSQIINGQFDGTMRPLAIVFVAATVTAGLAWRRACAVAPDPR